MSESPLLLRVSCVPDRLPGDRSCDVELQFALCNQGSGTIEIYPRAAKLAAIWSFAGVDCTSAPDTEAARAR